MPRQDETIWRVGPIELSLERPRVMGILNVTPDSFSDGGEHLDTQAALDWAFRMLDDGADIIDVGGESTRRGFVPVNPDEEATRIVPVVRELLAAGALVSVDTRHAQTAKLCARLGAQIINDVSGFTDPAMVEVATETTCGLVICRSTLALEAQATEAPKRPRRTTYLDSDPRSRMAGLGGASQGASDAAGEESDQSQLGDLGSSAAPAVGVMDRPFGAMGLRESRPLTSTLAQRSMAPRVRRRRFTLPESAPIMRKIMGFLGDQARILLRSGISHDRIALDPGAGYGTSTDEDMVIQRATAQMASMGYPLVCAVSRKRFVGSVAGVRKAKDRDAASIGVALASVQQGARIIRTHDVASFAQALDAWWAMTTPSGSRAFVSMGSNIGDRVGYLARAVSLIDELPATSVFGVSDAYESDPALGIATPVANAVVELRTELPPRVLLGHLLAIEKTLGRIRKEGVSEPQPRTIDLDLVFYEGERHAGKYLSLPHPGLAERDFVIVPMEDLMRDPERYLLNNGIAVRPREERVGIVRADLGPIEWERSED